jgi:hypothetical protein
VSKKLPDDSGPVERFKAMARELECDEDEATFRAKLAVIARHKPGAKVTPARKAKAPAKDRRSS